MENIFGRIENIYASQKTLREFVLNKEKEILREQKIKINGQLLNQGQSTVFLPPFDFAYFFALYEIIGRYLHFFSQNKTNFRVLEIGGGTSWGSFYLAKKFPHVKFISTNYDHESLKYASSIYKLPNLQFDFLDGLKQEKMKNQFDLVFFLEVFEHFKPKESLLLIKESVKSLKKGGKVIFSTPSREFTYGLPTLGWISHQTEYGSKEQLVNFLKLGGCKKIQIHKLKGENYARAQRLRVLLLFPFIILLRYLAKIGFSIYTFSHFYENRQAMKEENLKSLDLDFVQEQDKIDKDTLAYLCIVDPLIRSTEDYSLLETKAAA